MIYVLDLKGSCLLWGLGKKKLLPAIQFSRTFHENCFYSILVLGGKHIGQEHLYMQ
jgi:hypothetical protein